MAAIWSIQVILEVAQPHAIPVLVSGAKVYCGQEEGGFGYLVNGPLVLKRCFLP